jgi:hypothetical protein
MGVKMEEHRLRLSENRVLRIFGPKRDEVTGDWRKLLNEEFHNLYSSPSIIRVIKSRRMRCAGHVARMGVVGLTPRLFYLGKITTGTHCIGGCGAEKNILPLPGIKLRSSGPSR